MKIEKLNEDKIRVTLNMEDLNERDIDCHTFMANSIESQGIFLDLLNKAEEEVGFHTEDCRIMIEAIALKNGTFVLTITKIKHDKDKEKTENVKPKKLHIKRKNHALDFAKNIYSFDSFDSFCDFCIFIKDTLNKRQINDIAKSFDLYEYNSTYYLVISDINISDKNLQYICSSLTEFARFCKLFRAF